MSTRFTSVCALPAVLLMVLIAQGCAQSGLVGSGPAGSGAVSARGQPSAEAPEVRERTAQTFARATSALRSGRLDQAETLLLEVTRAQPELAGPWINLAQLYLVLDRTDDAERALDHAVQANPGSCAARNELGVLLRRRGEFAAAEGQYLACVRHQPDYPDVYLNLGILYELYLGRWADALAAYRQYQSLSAEPERRVEMWVVDLQRRLDA